MHPRGRGIWYDLIPYHGMGNLREARGLSAIRAKPLSRKGQALMLEPNTRRIRELFGELFHDAGGEQLETEKNQLAGHPKQGRSPI
eukprot:14307065-Heterocapsa_arctica.AAC.1